MRRYGAIVCILAGLAVAALGQDGLKKLSKAEMATAVAARVEPIYPAMAKQLRIGGEVLLEALVSETGAVEKVNIVSGNPVLTKPASEALSKWKFNPTVVAGKPAKVLAPVSFTFNL
jgi:protein TonB